uniref:Complement C1q subcomponent subunit A n=1 Tax=Gallus gallus TaxID=9031 RepID=A0A8V0YYT4_CHICK
MQLSLWLVTSSLAAVLGMEQLEDGVCRAPNGKDGFPGIPGLDGRPGQKGDVGEPGRSAPRTGIRGPKGDKGLPGMPGMPGLKGAKGNAGSFQQQQHPAFSASRTMSLFRGTTVVFNNIITNEENSYSPQTGEFTCSIPGIYYFAYQVVSNGDLCLSITKNAERVVSFCDNNSRNILQVNSGSSVLSLAMGDRVSVNTIPTKGNLIYHGSEADSVFSGFMLYPQTG